MDKIKAGSAFPSDWNRVVKTKIIPTHGLDRTSSLNIRLPVWIMCASFIKDWMIYGAKTLRITAVMSANVTSLKCQT